MAQRAATLTFKLSDATTQVVLMPAGASITPQHKLVAIRSEGGFWVAASGSAPGDTSSAGSVWVNFAQVVSCTIS
jgi:hypothetical protein